MPSLYAYSKITRIDSSHFVFTGKEWIQVKPLLSVHPFPGESLTSKSLGTGANMAAIKGSPMSCIDYLCLLVYLAFVSPGFKRSGISKSACPISRPCGVIIWNWSRLKYVEWKIDYLLFVVFHYQHTIAILVVNVKRSTKKGLSHQSPKVFASYEGFSFRLKLLAFYLDLEGFYTHGLKVLPFSCVEKISCKLCSVVSITKRMIDLSL